MKTAGGVDKRVGVLLGAHRRLGDPSWAGDRLKKSQIGVAFTRASGRCYAFLENQSASVVTARSGPVRQEGAALHAKYPVVENGVDGAHRVYTNVVNGDQDEARRRHEEHAREVRWLDTFFVDRISVVTPRGHPNYDREVKRPWEDRAWVARVDTLQRAFDKGKARPQQVHKR